MTLLSAINQEPEAVPQKQIINTNLLFEKAVEIVLKHEGKMSNDPKDRGGATNYGISLRYLMLKELDLNGDGAVDMRDILTLNRDTASLIYKKDWWDRYRYDLINDHKIAIKVFDLAIWMGANQAHKLLQTSLNRMGADLKIDGVLGSATLKALNDNEYAGNPGELVNELRDNSIHFIINLVADNPDLTKFKMGWLRRAAA